MTNSAEKPELAGQAFPGVQAEEMHKAVPQGFGSGNATNRGRVTLRTFRVHFKSPSTLARRAEIHRIVLGPRDTMDHLNPSDLYRPAVRFDE